MLNANSDISRSVLIQHPVRDLEAVANWRIGMRGLLLPDWYTHLLTSKRDRA